MSDSSETNLPDPSPPAPSTAEPEASAQVNTGGPHLAPHATWTPAEAFELFVESVRDYAMFLVTPDGRMGSWSFGVEHLLGYGEGDFLQLHLEDLFVPEDREAGAPAHEMRRAAAMGRAADDRWHLRADGSRLWVSGVLTSLLDENNNVRGFAKVMRDNTEQRLLQEEREALLASERAARLAAESLHIQAQDAQREAEAANRAKDQFIAVVTHELRSPLNVILGWTHMLRDASLEAEQRLQGLQTLERNALALGRLVEDLLDTTRIREDRIQLDMEPVEMGPLIAQALEEFRPAALEKDLTLHIDIECVALVNADAGRLRQVISNLLSNAVKFTPRGGAIWVTLECVDGTARLTVRDNGQGIAPEFLPDVFESFQQQKVAHQGGLGLGLAIVRSLVERHDGVVTAHSAGEGHGATFVVEIPEIQGLENCDFGKPYPE